jgi:hypothetical protein
MKIQSLELYARSFFTIIKKPDKILHPVGLKKINNMLA